MSGQEGDTPLRLVCSCNFQSAAERTIALKALLDAGADPNFFRDIAAARAEAERARVAAASAGHMLGQMKLDGSPSAVYAFVHGAAKLHELQARMTTTEAAAERVAAEEAAAAEEIARSAAPTVKPSRPASRLA